jgi:hypothetical protein
MTINEYLAAHKDADDVSVNVELTEDLRNVEAVARELRRQLAAKDARIADLEAQLAAAKAENATLAGLALDASNIFSYTDPV